MSELCHEWKAVCDNSGAYRPWFVAKIADGVETYYSSSKGCVIRFANYSGAQAKAEELNKRGGPNS